MTGDEVTSYCYVVNTPPNMRKAQRRPSKAKVKVNAEGKIVRRELTTGTL
jgi:hypothetical protein